LDLLDNRGKKRIQLAEQNIFIKQFKKASQGIGFLKNNLAVEQIQPFRPNSLSV
jgi:hypothetical protein